MIVIASYVLSIVAALLGVNYVIKEPNKKKGMAFALVAGASAAIGLFAPQIGFWVFMAELALFVGALVRDISHVRW